MRKLATFLFLSSACMGQIDEAWLGQVKNRADAQAIEWLRDKIKADLPSIEQVDLSSFTNKPCNNCFSGGVPSMEPKIYVFMSFSVPEETWLSLSRELGKHAGVFVLRGLPNNSFQEYARHISCLKQKGMNAEIQVNPVLFKQFNVNEVPAFLNTTNSGCDDIIKGNISLDYALNLMRRDES